MGALSPLFYLHFSSAAVASTLPRGCSNSRAPDLVSEVPSRWGREAAVDRCLLVPPAGGSGALEACGRCIPNLIPSARPLAGLTLYARFNEEARLDVLEKLDTAGWKWNVSAMTYALATRPFSTCL